MRTNDVFIELVSHAAVQAEVATVDQEDRGVLEQGWSRQLSRLDSSCTDRLQNGFVKMVQLNLEPEVVYYPRGLSWQTWADVLSNHITHDGYASEGVKGVAFDTELSSESESAQTQKRWGIALLCGKSAVAIPEIQQQNRVAQSILVGNIACSAEQYCGLQWKRLFSGMPPVDNETVTLVEGGDKKQYVMSWDAYKHAVVVNYAPPEMLYPEVGYRLALTPS